MRAIQELDIDPLGLMAKLQEIQEKQERRLLAVVEKEQGITWASLLKASHLKERRFKGLIRNLLSKQEIRIEVIAGQTGRPVRRIHLFSPNENQKGEV